ncbi:hypothetical protein WN944_005855 [Citrus x changshan-huyou]|uniref:Uncharacterized protein n=1 Tax=Citrus x changshan-huyou TaxID=2935761 RepID=A0AAP0QSY6_9ROSI
MLMRKSVRLMTDQIPPPTIKLSTTVLLLDLRSSKTDQRRRYRALIATSWVTVSIESLITVPGKTHASRVYGIVFPLFSETGVSSAYISGRALVYGRATFASTLRLHHSVEPKFGSLLAGLMELESDQVMVEEWRLGGGATDSVLCSSRSVDRNQIKILAEARWLLRGGRLQLASLRRRMSQPTGGVTVGGGFQVAGDRLCGYRWWFPSCKRGRPSLVGG